MSTDSIFGPIPTDPRDKLREAAAIATWTAQAARRAAEDKANFFVNEQDWQAWRAYQLDQAEKRERAAREYRELLGGSHDESVLSMVRTPGVEPGRPFGREILSLPQAIDFVDACSRTGSRGCAPRLTDR